MIAKNGIAPIKIPNHCTSAAGLGRFSDDVITAIKCLRDRRIMFDAPNFKPIPIRHEWKVRIGNETSTPGDYEWKYVGGDVITQGGTITVEDGVVEGPAGFVVAKITRDSTSREATAVDVEHSETLPVSDYTYQYVILAVVSPLDPDKVAVLQLQFERLNIHEMLVVSNGTFDLAQFRMASSNIYDLPP